MTQPVTRDYAASRPFAEFLCTPVLFCVPRRGIALGSLRLPAQFPELIIFVTDLHH